MKKASKSNPSAPYEKHPLFDDAVPVFVSLTEATSGWRVYVRRDAIVAFHKPLDSLCAKCSMGAAVLLDKKLIKGTGYDIALESTFMPNQPVLYVKETIAELSTVLPTVLIARG